MHLYRRCRCDRQRAPRRRARVGGLCGFRGAAERVPTGSLKTGRCADVRQKFDRSPAQRVRSKEEMQRNGRDLPLAAGRGIWSLHRRSGEAGEKPGAFLRQSVHLCPQCGQFWAVKTALFCEGEKWIGADFRKKPRLCRSCRHYFGAFHFWRG